MKIRGKTSKSQKCMVKPGRKKMERSKPVLLQLQENIREYKELVKKNWFKYHKYFQEKLQ